MIRPAQIREPLLVALGKATNFTSEHFVPYLPVVEETVRLLGFDTDSSIRKSSAQGVGLDRNITLAYRYGYRDCKPALTVRGSRVGYWALTEEGVCRARLMYPSEPPPPLPHPKTFYDPLLRVLARLGGYQPAVGFPHDRVAREVLTLAGHDPENLPPGWGERGSNKQVKAFDRVRWAVKTLKSVKTPWIMQPGRGLWALTEAGVAQALVLDPPPVEVVSESLPESLPVVVVDPPRLNVTAQWLEKHLSPPRGCRESELYRKMRVALHRRLRVSASAQLLDDHIQTFVMRAIKRDSLAKLIAAGDVPYSKVVAYCLNSGRSDVRNLGTDPIAREYLGARTQKERTTEQPSEAMVEQKPRSTDTDGSIIGDGPVYSSIDDELDFEAIWSRVEKTIQDRKPQAWDRYAGIIKDLYNGYSTHEIARHLGVTRNRAATMIAEARRCVREGYAEGELEGWLSRGYSSSSNPASSSKSSISSGMMGVST